MDENAIGIGMRLNVEVRVAGGLIWDSIEKISYISCFPKLLDKESEPNYTEIAICVFIMLPKELKDFRRY